MVGRCSAKAFAGRGDGSEDRPRGRAGAGVARTGCAPFLVFAQALGPPCLLFPARVTGSKGFPLKVLGILFGTQSGEWGTS